MQLNTNPEYAALLPELSRAEYEALKESIRIEGQHYPIVVNKEQVILDGHNRHKICLELGLQPKVELKAFANRLLEKKFVIESNLRRRQLNKFQQYEMAIPLLKIQEELAKERQLKGTLVQSCTKGRAVDIVADEQKLKPTTFFKVKTILQKGSTQLKEKVRKGQISINAACIQINRAEKHENTPELPEGEFDVIYADPPWKYDFCLEGDPRQHYQVMSTEEICALPVPVADNAILFLWATNPKLPDALKVIQAWGFQYKTNMAWVKNRKGPGYYFQSKHELLLIAKRGTIPPPTGDNRPPSVLDANQRDHSRKPDEVYGLIEKMYPNRKWLELFARNHRGGWVSWGSQNAQES